jgi:hypothetical protein
MTDESTTSAILTAINAVNDNIVATRGEVGSMREVVMGKLHEHDVEIERLKLEHAKERSWVKGFKYPLVAGGALLIVLADHWEHGKTFLSWFVK